MAAGPAALLGPARQSRRYRWHWRGRRAVKFLMVGFVLLALGFFGSKFVLELVLHRP